MAVDRRYGTKLPSWVDITASTHRVDPGPYVGVVKNNIDPARAGRLQVFIPDLGGNPDDQKNWRTLSYASPFFGSTLVPEATKNNEFDKVAHTYGMWAVPPDIGVEVLCMFVSGDPMRGYWFACVNSHLSHNMVPGLATGNIDKTAISDEKVKKAVSEASNFPTAEFNENDPANLAGTFLQTAKPVHEFQANILIEQGLDKDHVRGAITSSSQRETPSNVFGISTPGRPYPNDTADDPTYFDKLAAGTVKEEDYAVRARKGGHTFVMDDGDAAGNDQLMRLRTAGGHQILMNDKEQVVYIANSIGTVWMEFAPSGQLHVYSYGGINMRTEGDFNLHADKNLNIQAAAINIKSLGALNLDAAGTCVLNGGNKLAIWSGATTIGSGGNMAIYSQGGGSISSDGAMILAGSKISMNDGPGTVVTDPGHLKPLTHADARQSKEDGTWMAQERALTSIVKVAPTHEPWPRATGKPQGVKTTPATEYKSGGETTNAPVVPSKVIEPIECEGETGTTNDPGVKLAIGQKITKGLPREWLNRPDAPNPSSGVGPLSQYHTKCTMAQIAYTESGWKYDIVEVARGNYLGRYQVGAAVLNQFGYIKSDYVKQYGTRAVNYTQAWTGKDGINSKEDYLKSPAVQESVMMQLLQANYRTLVKINGIKPGDNLCTVAGMLTAAHLLGAGGAKTWRNTGGGADANGTTGAQYFNRGRYAVDILATVA